MPARPVQCLPISLYCCLELSLLLLERFGPGGDAGTRADLCDLRLPICCPEELCGPMHSSCTSVAVMRWTTTMSTRWAMAQVGSGACRRRIAQVRLQRVRGSAAFHAARLPGSGHVVGSTGICAQAKSSSWWPRTLARPQRDPVAAVSARSYRDTACLKPAYCNKHKPSLVQSARYLLYIGATCHPDKNDMRQ